MADAESRQKISGAVGKTAERARYIELTRQGLNNAEICRRLGISRKTRSKGRNGYKHRDRSGVVRNHAPIVEAAQRAEKAISERFLFEDKRAAMADMHAAGQSLRQIAASRGRAPSKWAGKCAATATAPGHTTGSTPTSWPGDAGRREHKSKIVANPELRAEIQELMRKL